MSAVVISILAMSLDLASLDAAIERCDRAAVQPVLADEMRRRSDFSTLAYAEQASINAERSALVGRRNALRQSAAKPASSQIVQETAEVELARAALDDRQQALEDRRRLEFLRREAVDLKRQYYLARCASAAK